MLSPLAISLLLICGLVPVFYGLFAWDSVRYRQKRHADSSGLHINYLYLLHRAKLVAASQPHAKMLDYGCGSGKVVQAARDMGLDVYGADVYYGASAEYKEESKRLGLYGNAILEIRDGRLEFEDGYFDFVMSNQVFEHVEDLNSVLGEIHRVMKGGGMLLCLFPSKDVIREGHIGVPFAHWFPKNSRARYYFTLGLRSMGIGYVKDNKKSKRQWTQDVLAWIDDYTRYRSKSEIFSSFSQYFQIDLIEDDYIKYRLSAYKRPALFARLLTVPLVRPLSRVLFRRMAGMVILAKKHNTIYPKTSNKI